MRQQCTGNLTKRAGQGPWTHRPLEPTPSSMAAYCGGQLAGLISTAAGNTRRRRTRRPQSKGGVHDFGVVQAVDLARRRLAGARLQEVRRQGKRLCHLQQRRAKSKICIRIKGTLGHGFDIYSRSDVDEDVWQNWTIVYDPAAQSARWYRNGQLDVERHVAAVGDLGNKLPLQFGHSHTWNGFYEGQMAEVKIWNCADCPRRRFRRSSQRRPPTSI